MSEQMEFGEFIVKLKGDYEFWCLSTVGTQTFYMAAERIYKVENIGFSKLKEYVEETKNMFSGKYYCGSVSIYFENESDTVLLRVKYPELNG